MLERKVDFFWNGAVSWQHTSTYDLNLAISEKILEIWQLWVHFSQKNPLYNSQLLIFLLISPQKKLLLLVAFQISVNCQQIITRSHVMIDGCCKHMKNVESSIHFIWKAILKMGCAEDFALVIQWKENAKFIW
jgi:hypothetical protein